MSALEQDLTQISKRAPHNVYGANIGIDRPLRNYFILQIGARAEHHEKRDGFAINVHLTNLFPRTITDVTVKVKVTSSLLGHELWFVRDNVKLPPGKSEVWTYCDITSPGPYVFERAVVEWHSLVFGQDFIDASKKQSLNLYPHGNALRVSAEMERESIPNCDGF